MSDPADRRAAYKEALARAEAAAVSGETPQTLTISTGTEEPPAVLTELEPPAETQQPPVVEPAEPAETSTEEATAAAAEAARIAELERQLAERDARIAEQQSMIGRQSTEVGELRSVVDEIRARMQQPAPPAVPITQDMIEDNPAGATMLAFQQQNEQALSIAFEAWKQEDPVTAAQWYADRRIEAMEAQMTQRLEAMRGEMQTVAAPAQEAVERDRQQATWREAFALVEAEAPGFTQDAVRLLEEVAPQFPQLAATIANGDAATKAEGLNLLAAFDQGRKQDPAAVAQAAADEARAAAEAAALARAGASVVSQETAGVGGSVPEQTPEQAEVARLTERYKARSKPFGGTWSR